MKLQTLVEDVDTQQALDHMASAAALFLQRQVGRMAPTENQGVRSGDVRIEKDYSYQINGDKVQADVALVVGAAHPNVESLVTDIQDRLSQYMDATIKHLHVNAQLLNVNGGSAYKIGNKVLRVTVHHGFSHSAVLVYQK